MNGLSRRLAKLETAAPKDGRTFQVHAPTNDEQSAIVAIRAAGFDDVSSADDILILIRPEEAAPRLVGFEDRPFRAIMEEIWSEPHSCLPTDEERAEAKAMMAALETADM